jgi:hypothetical protein
VDTRLDQNETEFSITILAVALQVLADGHSFLDQKVQIFRKLGGEAFLLQDSQHFVASHESDLGDSVGVSEDDTCEEIKILLSRIT